MVAPRRSKILGAQGDAGLGIPVALGEEVDNGFQLVVIGGRILFISCISMARRNLVPGLFGEAAVFREALLSQNARIIRNSAFEGGVFAGSLALEKIAGELNRLRPRGLCRGEMDIACALKESAAMAIRIINILDGPLDPVDCPLRKQERKPGARTRSNAGKRFKRRVHPGSPAWHIAIFNKSPRSCRAVDHFAQARLQRLVIGAGNCRRRIQLIEQDWIALGQVHDHRDKGVDAHAL